MPITIDCLADKPLERPGMNRRGRVRGRLRRPLSAKPLAGQETPLFAEDQWLPLIRAIDERLRPIATRPVDISDPNWLANLQTSSPLDEAGVRPAAQEMLQKLSRRTRTATTLHALGFGLCSGDSRLSRGPQRLRYREPLPLDFASTFSTSRSSIRVAIRATRPSGLTISSRPGEPPAWT
jgi:hypothetical protein